MDTIFTEEGERVRGGGHALGLGFCVVSLNGHNLISSLGKMAESCRAILLVVYHRDPVTGGKP